MVVMIYMMIKLSLMINEGNKANITELSALMFRAISPPAPAFRTKFIPPSVKVLGCFCSFTGRPAAPNNK